MSIELLRDYNVLDRVFLPITVYSSVVSVQPMYCTRLACITHSYSISDLICSLTIITTSCNHIKNIGVVPLGVMEQYSIDKAGKIKLIE